MRKKKEDKSKDILSEKKDPASNLVDKLYDSLFESIPKELYEVKEVPFDSDVVNSEFCIYFQNERNMFSLMRYPAPGDDLPQYILDAVRFFEKKLMRPRFLLIPFNVMSAYQARLPLFPGELPRPTLRQVCIKNCLVYTIMVPDRLKEKVKVI